MPYLCHHCKSRSVCPAYAESPPHGRGRGTYSGITSGYWTAFPTLTRIVGGYSTFYERPTEEEKSLIFKLKEYDDEIKRLKKHITDLETELKG